MQRRPSRRASTIQRQAISGNSTEIAARPADSGKLVSDDFQYFIRGMMPESANPAQQPETIIEIRPYRGGWQCFYCDEIVFRRIVVRPLVQVHFTDRLG